MEIHSSSLAFIPNGYQPKESTKQDTDNVKNSAQPALQLVGEVAKPLDTDGFNQLTTIIDSQVSVTSNSRTARAVDAYVQESIKPLKNQRSELISNIDFFI